MCGTQIKFNIQRTFKCRNDSWRDQLDKNLNVVLIKIMTMVFLLGAAGFLSGVSYRGFSHQPPDSMLTVNLGIAIVSLLMTGLLVGLFIWLLVLFVKMYLINTTVKINGVGGQ